MNFPRTWVVVSRYIAMPADQAALFWKALSRSQYERPRMLRAGILAYDCIPMEVSGFTGSTCSPASLVTVCEDLVHEGRLPRTQASQIKEYILNHTASDGRWK